MRLTEIEERIKKYWIERRIPEKWRGWVDGRPVFSFLEGPPTANGYPHVGHLRGRTYKDTVLRYYRILGYNVWAQGGWDEQGLPVEVEVEKKLGIKNKKEIYEKVGLEKFIEECNKLVNHYLSYWEDYATWRLGLWLDLEGAYETRKAHYIEHVWNFIYKAYEKGLLYKGYRVLPFCPRCETALSDMEVDQGYKDKVSPSIYVKFRLEGDEDTYLIIWTTTPWTLIDNEAVAVYPDGDYVKVRVGDEYWIIAKNLVDEVIKLSRIGGYEVIEEFKGIKLEKLKYIHPLLDEVPVHKEHSNAHYITLADYVSLDEGTGLVHTAPGHGPEDYETGMRYGLPITSSVEINGVFNEYSGVFKGLDVDEASKLVIEILRNKDLLIYCGKIVHSYPHCWRCGTPLIYRADVQWFIKTTEIRDKFLDALSKVEIYPEKLRNRFEDWLKNLRDWTISRSRIWGTPLPIWICKDEPDKILIIKSVDELKKYAKKLPDVDDDKLVHRPWIDMIEIEYDGCDKWVREPYVVDVWIDSGMAWIASVDGLRNKDLFNKLYPYDFITEAVDQTRGWFYSLLATSVIYNDIAPYRRILIQGHVLDKYGKKMSKHLGNVIWATDLFKNNSIDASRLYILSRYAPGDPFNFDPEEIKDIVSILNIIWNIFRFAYTYMDLDNFDPSTHNIDRYGDRLRIEDRWIISRINTVLKDFKEYMGEYEIHRASKELIDFLVNDVSRVYIRLVRPRVWIEEGEDKYIVYSTLYYVLIRAMKLMSILTPHYAEEIWLRFFRRFDKNLEESIHLSKIEDVEHSRIDSKLEKNMRKALEIVSVISSLRNKLSIKLRWPVRVAYVEGEDYRESVTVLADIIKFLANLKELKYTEDISSAVDKDMELHEEEGIKVAMPRKLDLDLYYEAMARELIRRIQVMRNEMDLKVDEFIKVSIETRDNDILESINRHRKYIMNEVRATEIGDYIESDMYVKNWRIEDYNVRIGVKRLLGQ